MKILVSGFEPFLDEKVNPTQAMAEFVNSCDGHTLVGLDVRGVVLPVVFDQAFETLEAERKHFQPDVVLSLGLASGRAHFEVEMVAVNSRGGNQTSRGDNLGQVFDGAIRAGAPLALPTTLPVDKIIQSMTEAGLPARRSFSAGTYVCNDLFFQLQERLRFTRVQSGFIHVPKMVDKATADSKTEFEWPKFRAALLAALKAFTTKS